ncbi:JAB domain-containing protein [Desulfonema ishimotonii]|uniref:JAB domain-containing protein n=1 Tax=Desulfonema ishimotonii TaxID=45657 RepID=A0A401G0M0_9BACT|nr:DNA repair protein RadC [Desulfonema ishimotonii]GBC62747.1 JAB domain-containing protein [Desulfonema ishimotonii]
MIPKIEGLVNTMYICDNPETAKRMADLPEHERPREKLEKNGAQALSDRELMAILLGKGRKGRDVLAMAADILEAVDRNGGFPDHDALRAIKGVGPAKASVIMAALEFSRRRIRPEGTKISSPADVLPLLRHYADRKQEHLICLTLNGGNEVIATRVITIGLLNRTQIHPREVFADAVTDRAAAIVLAHNHPSGNVSPSSDDHAVTRRIRDSGEVLGIPLLDHLVFTLKGYYSFKEHGDI